MTKKSTRLVAGAAALTFLLSGCGKNHSNEVSADALQLQQEYEAKVEELEETITRLQSEKEALETEKASLQEHLAIHHPAPKQEDEPENNVVQEYSVDELRVTPTKCDCEYKYDYERIKCHYIWCVSDGKEFVSTCGGHFGEIEGLSFTKTFAYLEKDSVSLREYLTSIGFESFIKETYSNEEARDILVKASMTAQWDYWTYQPEENSVETQATLTKHLG